MRKQEKNKKVEEWKKRVFKLENKNEKPSIRKKIGKSRKLKQEKQFVFVAFERYTPVWRKV